MFLSADRSGEAIFPDLGVQKNMMLSRLADFTRLGFLSRGEERGSAEKMVSDFTVVTASLDKPISGLSGGNQQKAVLAREFDRDLKLLVLDQPTRGLDVGSIEFIHRQVIAKRDAGTAVLLVSAELDEVLEMSDRIGVMYAGRIVAILDGRTADKNAVGLLMATGGEERSAPPPAVPA